LAIEKITMPQLGESVTEGTISKWLVSVGDKVDKYDPLAEVMTDKVNAEIPSSFSGIIQELIADEGDTLEVGMVICTIEIVSDGVIEQVEDVQEKASAETLKSVEKDEGKPNKRRYSPAVLRMAGENNIDLELVNGTGAGGRITRKDLITIIEHGNIPKASVTTNKANTAINEQKLPESPVETAKEEKDVTASYTSQQGDIEIPLSGIRKAIAAKMLKSKHDVPHAWTMIEVDVTPLVNYRNSLKADFKQREGFNLTFFAFFVKAVAQALKEFPQINSMWAGDKIIQKKDINISIAVGTEDALYVPVIKHADEKTIKGIAREITDLANRVRTNKLKSEDMQDGTFTVNNTGTFGSVQSMGIINHPQAAILQVESIVKRPVVINDMIAIRDMVNLCLSIDHRVLDGIVSGRFLARVKEILEQTSKDNTPIY
jgi:2-oxoisovalerate dehydrogenase E2 component (dihydrolipoyl transacylase)